MDVLILLAKRTLKVRATRLWAVKMQAFAREFLENSPRCSSATPQWRRSAEMRKGIHEVVTESGGKSQSISRKNFQGFFKWQFGVLKKCSNQKKQVSRQIFSQIGSYRSIQQFCRRQFEEKNLAQYLLFFVVFFGLATFFKPQIVRSCI